MRDNPFLKFKGQNREALQELKSWEPFTITEENTKAMLTRCIAELNSIPVRKRSSNQVVLLNKLNILFT